MEQRVQNPVDLSTSANKRCSLYRERERESERTQCYPLRRRRVKAQKKVRNRLDVLCDRVNLGKYLLPCLVGQSLEQESFGYVLFVFSCLGIKKKNAVTVDVLEIWVDDEKMFRCFF